jgi:phosphogluconate dehydratase
VPAAIHLSPEGLAGGAIERVKNGDMIVLDCDRGTLEVEVDAATLAARSVQRPDFSSNEHGTGRDIFALFRRQVSSAETGASPLFNQGHAS